MSARHTTFLTGVADVLAAADAGGPHSHGVSALTRLVDVLGEVLGVGRVTYSDVVGRSARTIAATRGGRHLLGRHLDLSDADLEALGRGPWAGEDPVAGASRYLPVRLRDRPVGRLELAEGEHDPDVLRLAAVVAAHLVGDHEAAPQPTPPAEELFIAAAGHELRTPATVIKGYADTLRYRWDRLDDDARREAVEVIAARADALAALADRILDGDLGTGGELRDFDLAEAVRGAVATLPADLAVRLHVTLSPGSVAFGDPGSLPLVLGELATNAGRYSPKGTPIEILATSAGPTACLQVSDRGDGLTPEQARLAFRRFWRADRGDGGRYGGVGLGLYLVRQIVERQHGWVTLAPRRGGGTVVEVRWPRAAHAEPR
ncbi:hypothetical protein Afil01_61310 [Actinorhabdospora filicis]|uniref:histidine kinase n=1 Tax=Actinorhabdospora filicis TaxID=1785913 RepID=A0A9W6SST9_9ACTN|nr:HAMP domain-containing sensor histidine kinase [Actinorhabdospora filicis]GLZ81324.1 hypothetical protein Afil01_61310 [Actinorhabdospora filicis]